MGETGRSMMSGYFVNWRKGARWAVDDLALTRCGRRKKVQRKLNADEKSILKGTRVL